MHYSSHIVTGSILNSIISPLLVASLTYFIFGKIDELRKRKEYSRLGVAVIGSLEEEVRKGLEVMTHAFNGTGDRHNLLPSKSWQGINTINNNILLRILEVTKDSPDKGFPSSEIRIHTKNYFDHVVENWNEAVRKSFNDVEFFKYVKDYYVKFPEAAQGVLDMLQNVSNLLEENCLRIWPR